jgi:hypothetical protein
MSKWSEEILREHELQAQFDRGVSYAQIKKAEVDEQMWYEWAENNRFILQDGQIIEGKINP